MPITPPLIVEEGNEKWDGHDLSFYETVEEFEKDAEIHDFFDNDYFWYYDAVGSVLRIERRDKQISLVETGERDRHALLNMLRRYEILLDGERARAELETWKLKIESAYK